MQQTFQREGLRQGSCRITSRDKEAQDKGALSKDASDEDPPGGGGRGRRSLETSRFVQIRHVHFPF